MRSVAFASLALFALVGSLTVPTLAAPGLDAQAQNAAPAQPAAQAQPAASTPQPGSPPPPAGQPSQAGTQAAAPQAARTPAERRRSRTYARCNRAAYNRNLRGGSRRRFLIRCRLGYERGIGQPGQAAPAPAPVRKP